MTLFFKYILGFRDFSKIEEIKKFINLNLYYSKEEDILNAEHLLLFDTSKQKTWILISNLRMFCVLDDISKDTFQPRWHLNKNEIIRNGKIILEIKVHEEYSHNSGLIDFGNVHKKWLYSKKLFPNPNKLVSALKQKIQIAMA